MECRTGEPRERRKAQRRLHTVEIHVLGAFHGVIAAGNHVLELHRLEAVFLVRTACDSIQPNLGMKFALIGPEMVAVLVLDNPRPVLEVLGR